MSPLRIAFATAALMLVAAAPAPAATTVFGGATKASEPIALTGDRAAKKLRSATITVDAACADGHSWNDTTRVRPSDLTRNAKGRFAGSVDTLSASGGSAIFESLTLSGRLAAHRASGTLKLDVTSLDGTTDCHSGPIHWSATRSPGRLFGGSTSQQEPVVVKLNPRRTKVADVLMGWETNSCTPDGWYRQGDEFTNLPLHAARFGDGFSNTMDDGSGGKVTFDYAIAGTVKRTTSKGTLHVGLTDTDASGATAVSCDSGRIAWKATTG